MTKEAFKKIGWCIGDIANFFKHGGIDKGRQKNNKYNLIEPRLEKTFVHLVNNSFPEQLKHTA